MSGSVSCGDGDGDGGGGDTGAVSFRDTDGEGEDDVGDGPGGNDASLRGVSLSSLAISYRAVLISAAVTIAVALVSPAVVDVSVACWSSLSTIKSFNLSWAAMPDDSDGTTVVVDDPGDAPSSSVLSAFAVASLVLSTPPSSTGRPSEESGAPSRACNNKDQKNGKMQCLRRLDPLRI